MMKQPDFLKSQWRLFIFCLFGTAVAYFNYFIVQSQNPTTPATLQGQTQTVTLRPWGTVHAGRINYSLDTDHDGMPDDVELANGLDPNNPADADGDLDGDGLTNGDEVTLGTGLQMLDSDGDGVSDAEEVRQGYNPLDATSTPPTGIQLISIRVTPTNFGLNINTLLGAEPVQLQVTGVLSNNQEVDLTSSPATTYESLDQSIAVIDSRGIAIGVGEGITSIRVRNTSFTAEATVAVTQFTPRVVSTVRIQAGGFANAVDLTDTHAFVAAGLAGLQVIDISNPEEAFFVGTKTLPFGGNGNDVKVANGHAYVAAGNAGLQIFSIANPTNPQLVGGLVFPGAVDVAVVGTTAYVAAKEQGCVVVDISNPSRPVLAGTLPVPSPARVKGVDIDPERGLAILAVDRLGILAVDVTNPAQPQVLDTLALPNISSTVRDVTLYGSMAYVVGSHNILYPGLYAVDTSTPTQLRALAGDLNFVGTGFKASNQFGFASVTDNSVTLAAIFSLLNPLQPQYAGVIPPLRNLDGTGIAVTDTHVFVTGSNEFIGVFDDKGVSGSTDLVIAEVRRPRFIGPAIVEFSNPTDAQNVVAGDPSQITVVSKNNVFLASLEVKANGIVIGTTTKFPYSIPYTFSLTPGPVLFEAQGVDEHANPITVPPITVQIVPDPLTTIVGDVSDMNGNPVFGAQVILSPTGQITTTDDQGKFSFSDQATIPLGRTYFATIISADQTLIGRSISQPAVRQGETDLWSVRLGGIHFSSPPENTPLIIGEAITLSYFSSANLLLESVELTANGIGLGRFDQQYFVPFTVPRSEGNQIRFESRGFASGLVIIGQPLILPVVESDPLTTVIGRVVDPGGNPLANAQVVLQPSGQTLVTNEDGQFEFTGISTVPLGTRLEIYVTDATGNESGYTSSVAVRGGVTNVGEIVLGRTGS